MINSREIQPLGSTSSDDWDKEKRSRIQKVKAIIQELGGDPSLLNAIRREARDWVMDLVSPKIVCTLDREEDFFAMTGRNWLDIAKMSAESIVRDLGSEDAKYADLATTFEGSQFLFFRKGLEDGYYHTPETEKGVDKAIEALVPNLALGIHLNHQSVLDRGRSVEGRNLARFDSNTDWIEFGTVIPGMTLAYFFNQTNRNRRLVTVQANPTNGSAMPKSPMF